MQLIRCRVAVSAADPTNLLQSDPSQWESNADVKHLRQEKKPPCLSGPPVPKNAKNSESLALQLRNRDLNTGIMMYVEAERESIRFGGTAAASCSG